MGNVQFDLRVDDKHIEKVSGYSDVWRLIKNLGYGSEFWKVKPETTWRVLKNRVKALGLIHDHMLNWFQKGIGFSYRVEVKTVLSAKACEDSTSAFEDKGLELLEKGVFNVDESKVLVWSFWSYLRCSPYWSYI